MNDVYYLKAGLFPTGLNRVKKSLILNARILFFTQGFFGTGFFSPRFFIPPQQYHLNNTCLLGFIFKRLNKALKQAYFVSISHCLHKFQFW